MILQKNTGIIKEFFAFIIRPNYNIKNEDTNWKQSVFKLIKLFLFCFILKILAVYIINQTGIESGVVERIVKRNSLIMALLLGCIISPLIEELSYRLPLRFSVWNVTLSVFILSYDLITTYIFNTKYSDLGNYFAVRSGFALLAGIITYYLSKHYCERLQEFWTTHFRWILYFFCFYFAMLHITNYDLTTKIILLIPVLVLPQLIGGFDMSFVRMKYGFLTGLLFHCINNFISFLPSALLKIIGG